MKHGLSLHGRVRSIAVVLTAGLLAAATVATAASAAGTRTRDDRRSTATASPRTPRTSHARGSTRQHQGHSKSFAMHAFSTAGSMSHNNTRARALSHIAHIYTVHHYT